MDEKKPKPLTSNQVRALNALLTHKTITEAAKDAKLSEKTFQRYLKDDSFAWHFREAHANLIADNVRRLTGATSDALTTLHKLMESGESDAVKVRAAKELLTGFLKFKEILNLEARILDLEKAIEANRE